MCTRRCGKKEKKKKKKEKSKNNYVNDRMDEEKMTKTNDCFPGIIDSHFSMASQWNYTDDCFMDERKHIPGELNCFSNGNRVTGCCDRYRA